MTITITGGLPNDTLCGPGVPLHLISTFIGPLPTGSYFEAKFTTVSGSFIWLIERYPTSTVGNTFFVLSGQASIITFEPRQPIAGQAMGVTVDLNDTTGVVDSGGPTALTWDPVIGLGIQAAHLLGSGGGGSSLLAQILANVTKNLPSLP